MVLLIRHWKIWRLCVYCPCDVVEAKKATLAIAGNGKPSYIRLGRDKSPVMTTEETPFHIGEAEVFKEGKDVSIIACGQMVYQALVAAKELEEDHISARVINNHTIKPLDELVIRQAAEETGAIVTAEEHQRNGGLGSAVAEFLAEVHPVPIIRIGINDRYGESGEPQELRKHLGLTSKEIKKAVLKVLRLKGK